MKPPLPDNFGNYALGDFTEVLAPAAVNWWPQTSGWLWLGVLLGLYLLYRAWAALRRWHRNRYRREAQQRLTQLFQAPTDSTLITAASEALKVTALAVFPRPQIASLSGRDWIEFLNSRCEHVIFDAELTGLMADAQYRSTSPSASQKTALLAACQLWAARHRGPADV